ncbi:Cupredoxin [Gracilaria domingensis]|nr:Cupredoxin [Gracilaria domingensis]
MVVDPKVVDLTHYVAADEIGSDYKPLGKDGCTATLLSKTKRSSRNLALPRVARGILRPSAESTATLHAPVRKVGVRAPSPAWLNCLRFGANINFVGQAMLKSTPPGALGVSSGGKVSYLLRVRREAGLSRSDLSAVRYVYYLSVDPISHSAVGVTGVMAVTKRRGLRRRSRLPTGTSRAYPLVLQIFREIDSPLIPRSLQKLALDARNITSTALEELAEHEDWLESNAMHSINGYLYENNPVRCVNAHTSLDGSDCAEDS